MGIQGNKWSRVKHVVPCMSSYVHGYNMCVKLIFSVTFLKTVSANVNINTATDQNDVFIFALTRDTMSNGPVDCVVKTPVSLQIGDTVTDTLRPGVYITDIVFPNGKPIKVKLHAAVSQISTVESALILQDNSDMVTQSINQSICLFDQEGQCTFMNIKM